MSNLLSMLYTGVTGIYASQAQLDVTGHNIANINNPNYSRQRVNLASSFYQTDSYGTFGRGVNVVEVIRVYDELLAKTLRNESSSLAYWKSSQNTLERIRLYFNELERGSGLGEALRNYFNAWQDLSTASDHTDESYVKRTQLLASATQLATQIRDDREMFTSLQDELDYRLKGYVEEINTYAKGIAELNQKIIGVEAGGRLNANDLRDHRDALVNKIATLAGINVVERPNGEFAVFVGGEPIVDGGRSFELTIEKNPANGNHYDIVWNNGDYFSKGSVITNNIYGGVIQADIKMRDEIINGYISELDSMAHTLVYETNKVHVSGQGLVRYDNLVSTNAVVNPEYWLNHEPGIFPYEVKAGTFQIHIYDESDPDNKVLMTTYNIEIDPAKDTLNGVAEKISGADGSLGGGIIEATTNRDGTVKIKVASGYTFSFGDDTSDFLIAAGFNNFFQGTNASDIKVDSHIEDNPQFIAASKGDAPGDNRNALSMIEVKYTKATVGNNITIEEFYGYFVGQLATDKQQVDIFVITKQMTYTQFSDKMEQIKGVSMEEEQINLIQFQRVLQANSRYINAIDEMLHLIVNNLGLVGR
ncbi:MAG: flagellar hook-associated protein FlgK [Deferribacteraceae bacterium]|jgi:flagellar hook-associated protein 1 FlgK|nr:flagellar hook-associated protein FlgK [Deferribacteraceae bacterium]